MKIFQKMKIMGSSKENFSKFFFILLVLDLYAKYMNEENTHQKSSTLRHSLKYDNSSDSNSTHEWHHKGGSNIFGGHILVLYWLIFNKNLYSIIN